MNKIAFAPPGESPPPQEQIPETLKSPAAAIGIESQIHREALYGKTTVAVLDENGNPCLKAYVDDSGRIIEPSQMMTARVDSLGSPMEEKVCRDGQPVENIVRSFDDVRALAAVSDEEAATFATESVYPIVEVAGLKPGIYKSTFNYRASPSVHDCLVLIGEAPAPSFMLTGTFCTFGMAGKAIDYSLFAEDSEDESAADFDFDF